MSKFKDRNPVESVLVDLISVVVSFLLRGLGGFICSFGAKQRAGRLVVAGTRIHGPTSCTTESHLPPSASWRCTVAGTRHSRPPGFPTSWDCMQSYVLIALFHNHLAFIPGFRAGEPEAVGRTDLPKATQLLGVQARFRIRRVWLWGPEWLNHEALLPHL